MGTAILALALCSCASAFAPLGASPRSRVDVTRVSAEAMKIGIFPPPMAGYGRSS